MIKKPLISVVFPTLNSSQLLPSFFNSLKQQTYSQKKLEIIIVDNASKDNTISTIKKTYPKAKLIKLTKNIGFGPAVNIAAKKAKGKIIFITNDDVTFNKTCIEELVNLLNSNPEIGMVSGKLLMQKPKGIFAWPGFKLNPWLGFQPYDTSQINKVRESDWFSGPAMMIKKDVLKKAGYFDEGYFFAGEDYDLSLTIKQLGYKIFYTPKAIIHHSFRRTGKVKGENYHSMFNHYRGRFRCVIKNAHPLQMLTYFPIQLILVPIQRLFTTDPQNTFTLILALTNAIFWNLANLPLTLKARTNKNKLLNQFNLNTNKDQNTSQLSQEYDQITEEITMPDYFYQNIIDHLGTTNNHTKILDIGCGNGHLLKRINTKHPKASLTGMDFSKNLIINANKLLSKKILLIQADANQPPFQKHSFNIIILSEVLEHLEKPENVLKKIKPLLKTDGFLILTAPNSTSYTPFYPIVKKLPKTFPFKYIRNTFIPYEDPEKTTQPFDACLFFQNIYALVTNSGFKIQKISASTFFPYLGNIPIISSLMIFLWFNTPFNKLMQILIGPTLGYRILIKSKP